MAMRRWFRAAPARACLGDAEAMREEILALDRFVNRVVRLGSPGAPSRRS
jgi:hypothetical protein